jgi:protein-disulfide isomerase
MPAMRLAVFRLEKLESTYGTRLRVVFREFPLAGLHKNAFDAARAAEAAELQGRFWEMHDKLYENQKCGATRRRTRVLFLLTSRVPSASMSNASRATDGQIANSRILLDMKRGDSLGVKGTPTIFINSREVKADDMTLSALTVTIDAALLAGNQNHK